MEQNDNAMDTTLNIEKFRHLVGMTVESAKEEIAQSGSAFKVRVKTNGGVYTQDMNYNRLNLHAEHGVVKSLSIG